MQACAAAGDSARGKTIILQQGCTRWPGGLPCTAPGHSIPHGQPRQRLCCCTCHRSVTPCTHLDTRAGPQCLLTPWGLQQHHRHSITLNHKITGGSQGLATQSGPL